MVVLAGGGLAMGRYEMMVGEYRAFVSAGLRPGFSRFEDAGLSPYSAALYILKGV